jgi:hypothetical protein
MDLPKWWLPSTLTSFVKGIDDICWMLRSWLLLSLC